MVIYNVMSFHARMLAENSVFIWVVSLHLCLLSMQLMHVGNQELRRTNLLMGCGSKSITNKAICKLINTFQIEHGLNSK